MFRLKAYQIAAIERQVQVPLTGTRSYLVTVSQGGTFIKPVFSNGAKLNDSPVDWCHNISTVAIARERALHRENLDHVPTETDDEFLESIAPDSDPIGDPEAYNAHDGSYPEERPA